MKGEWQTGQGANLLLCVLCLRDDQHTNVQAITVVGGNALCRLHIEAAAE